MTHIEDRWVIRARELADLGGEGWLDVTGALVLGAEMADARAEYIALKIDDRVNRSVCIRNAYDEAITCAEIARSTIEPSKKPTTREAVLEAALRRILAPVSDRCATAEEIARHALRWQPHTERTPRPD